MKTKYCIINQEGNFFTYSISTGKSFTDNKWLAYAYKSAEEATNQINIIGYENLQVVEVQF